MAAKRWLATAGILAGLLPALGAAPSPAPGIAAQRLLEDAVGGRQSIKPYQVRARGVRTEPLQGLRPGDVIPASSFDLTATFDPLGERERLSWRREFSAATVAPGQRLGYDEILTSGAGYVEGADTVSGAGSGGPMVGTRLAAIRRQQELLNPTVYLAGVLREGRTVRFAGRVGAADVVEVDDRPRPVTLFFVGGDLIRLITQESDFYLGNVTVRVDYAQWRRVEGGRYPFRVDLSLDGITILRQEVRSISRDPDINPATFALPVTVPVPESDVRIGRTNAQWFNRVLAFPFGPLFIRGMSPYAVSARQIAPKVILVPGAPAPVVSLAVDLGNSILVAEPAISNEYSARVIAAVKAFWRGKPISHVVATQWHFDTTGGIRQYAAIGAEVVVPGEVSFFREILSRPRTIDPDLLSRSRIRPIIRPVGAGGIALGGVTVHRFASAREARMLLVCMRGSDLAYTGDLFNPAVFTADRPGPEPYRTWARDMYRAIQDRCPWVQRVLASHGMPQPEPIATLRSNAQ